MHLKISERMIIFLIASIQFVNILEFMIVIPLGPDFSRDLNLPLSSIGFVGGAYTAAAAVSGLAVSFFIERFDRRSALIFLVAGLMIATAAAGFSYNYVTLILARVTAGLFGGPATAVALAIIADVIPPERRGKAMGMVMAAFAVASVAGVPLGLEISRLGGWRLPFFIIAAFGSVVTLLVWMKIPPLRSHFKESKKHEEAGFFSLLKRQEVQFSLIMGSLTMIAIFMLIPIIAPYVLGNLGYPREKLGLLYFAGGSFSFFSMQIVGRLVDKFGPAAMGSIGVFFQCLVILGGFVYEPNVAYVILIFIGLMTFNSMRNVAFQSLASMVPLPFERARFMALQYSVQNLSISIGAFFSTALLTDGPFGTLVGVPRLGWLAILLSCITPLLFYRIQYVISLRQRINHSAASA